MDSAQRRRLRLCNLAIHSAAVGAGCWAFAFAQIPGADETGLTAITITMAGSLAVIYRVKEVGGLLAMASVALGTAFGERLAAQLHKYIPGLGNWTNATSTFALHEATGWLLVAGLEKFKVTGVLPDLKKMSEAEKQELLDTLLVSFERTTRSQGLDAIGGRKMSCRRHAEPKTGGATKA